MPDDRRPSDLSHEQIDALAFAALQKEGVLLPSTENEIASLEKELEVDPVALPPALQDPLALLERNASARSGQIVPGPWKTDCTETKAGLARAAREGSAISSEVEAEMQRLREQFLESEREGEADDDDPSS
jgi:hypothetical protein